MMSALLLAPLMAHPPAIAPALAAAPSSPATSPASVPAAARATVRQQLMTMLEFQPPAGPWRLLHRPQRAPLEEAAAGWEQQRQAARCDFEGGWMPLLSGGCGPGTCPAV
jgi:hypothetical protein